MAYNGSGVFVIGSAGQPVVATTLITAVAFNALTADLATGLSTCITKDGQTTITQNIPFNNKKITGLAAASARTDAASIATIQDGTGVYVATVGGTADVITLTAAPAITAYAAGQTFRFIASGANTTNVTVAISGLAAKAITKNGTTALIAGDIPSGMMVEITYDGTRFILGTTGLSTSITPADNIFRIVGSADATKKAAFEVDGLTTGTTRTYTLQDSSDVLVGRATTDTLTNKTLTSPTINTPTLTGAILGTPASGVITNLTGTAAGATVGGQPNIVTLGTPVASTSGTSIDFTSIPSGVKRITIMLMGVSTNGGDDLLVQLGDAGGIETSGYLGTGTNIATSTINSTAGLVLVSGSAAHTAHGTITLSLLDAAAFKWVMTGIIGLSNIAELHLAAASKATSAELDRVRITTTGGTNTFDAGVINISYE